MKDKVLVIGPAWVGDMILAQSLFKLLKQQSPQCEIDVAAPGWTLPLLERMPEVNRRIALPFRHGKLDLLQRIRIGYELRQNNYTKAILLTNSLKSAIVPFCAGIPQRTGFLGEMRYGLLNDIRSLDKQKLPRTVDRFASLGLAPGAEVPAQLPQPALAASREGAFAALAKLDHAAPQTPVLALCPGAEYGPAKRWPTEYYAEVANRALTQGWEVWLFGSQKDIPVTDEINVLTRQRCFDLGGRTALGEAVDLMSLASAVASNDSGLMHVAAALDKPMAAIYGSSDPHHTPPMSAQARVLYLGLSCSPCFKRECPLGHLNCLKQLAPEQVMQTLPFG